MVNNMLSISFSSRIPTVCKDQSLNLPEKFKDVNVHLEHYNDDEHYTYKIQLKPSLCLYFEILGKTHITVLARRELSV